MPTIDLTDEEHAALTAAARKVIDEDRYPLSRRLDPLKSALAKLDPRTAPKPLPEPKPRLPEGDRFHWIRSVSCNRATAEVMSGFGGLAKMQATQVEGIRATAAASSSWPFDVRCSIADLGTARRPKCGELPAWFR